MVRDRVAKARLDLEVRLRSQIEQEMKDEMLEMQKREVKIFLVGIEILLILEGIKRALRRHRKSIGG